MATAARRRRVTGAEWVTAVVQNPPTRRGNGPATPRDPLLLLHRLLKLANRISAPFNAYLEQRYRITLNDFRLLMSLGHMQEAAAHELMEVTGVNGMTVSRSVAALRRQGRVSSVRDAANRRRKLLRLTPEGQELYERMLPTADKVATYLVAGLRQRDLAHFARTVAAMTRRLEAVDREGKSVFLERTRP